VSLLQAHQGLQTWTCLLPYCCALFVMTLLPLPFLQVRTFIIESVLKGEYGDVLKVNL
jgi:hypothetical protein